MIENIGKHYLYRHIRLDTGEPFYIGIGTKIEGKVYDEAKYKRAHIIFSRNKWWKNIVEKTPYEVEILLESDDYEFIKQKEIEFIALYGRRDLEKGTLVNMTDGGEGTKGRAWTQEQKEKQAMITSNFFKGVPKSKEHKEKIGRKGELNHAFGKPAHNSGQKMLVTSGENNYKSKKVINTETLKLYSCIREASEKEKINYSTLRSYLQGKLHNKTSLKYYEK